MRQALDTIAQLVSGGACDARTLPWAGMRYEHTQAVRAALAERYAPATANKMLAALRGVLREAWRLDLLPAEAYRRAADLPAVRGVRLPRGRALSTGELRALFAACAADPSPAGARDAALLAVLYGAGLRRAESVNLDVGDYEADGGSLTVRRGKGRKARRCYLATGGQAALRGWLAVRCSAPGPLFLPIDKAGCIGWRRLSDQAVLVILRKRARQAVVATFSPHDLRRTFISDLLEQGADVSAVQQLAGHANVATTARYDRRGEQAKRRAAALLHVPYAGSCAAACAVCGELNSRQAAVSGL
jgi:site-specific recombinase XerD